MTTSTFLLETLISALNSHNGLKAILESLYLWLIHNTKEFGSRKSLEGLAPHLNLEDVICISSALFEELSKRLFVPLDNSSTTQSIEQAMIQFESNVALGEIVMLLRCCMASVNLLENDQCLLLGRCEFLNRIICMLCSCQNIDSSEGCKIFTHLKSDIHFPLVCHMLEVFMDELITNKSLSKYIKISASVSSAREIMCHCVDSGYLGKIVSAHFVQSFSRPQTFEGSVENLIWPHKENRATPEISLTAAVSLLINPALASPPALLHGHLISLISDVIGVTVYDQTGFSLNFVNCYMSAFERSVSLYHRQLQKLVPKFLSEHDDSVIRSGISGFGRQLPFESCVCRTMNERLNSVIKEIDFSSGAVLSQRKSNMVAILNSYVKENLHLLDESCRNIASSFLSFVITKAISAESGDSLLHDNWNLDSEDILLLASILKLMSCSLLQTVLYMLSVRKSSSCCPFQLKEHELLVHIINSFGQYWIKFPLEGPLHDKLETEFSSLKGSRLMFVHFTGLLSICLVGGNGILAKGCLYMMINLMNLLFFEDGSLKFVSQLAGLQTECELPQHLPAKVSSDVDSSGGMQEGYLKRRSSVALASEFKRIQMSRTRKRSASRFQDEKDENTSVEEDETCNGMTFLKCLNKISGTSVGCLDEEIVDFIECEKGKDYSAWLKNRTKYRTKKLQKASRRSTRRKKKP